MGLKKGEAHYVLTRALNFNRRREITDRCSKKTASTYDAP